MPMQATTTTPLFSAALRPDRSLRATGGWVALAFATLIGVPLMVALPEIALVTATALVLAAVGLTVFSLRQSRQRRISQAITLWSDQIEIATTDIAGKRSLLRLDPHKVRLLLERDDDEKTQAIRLSSGGDSVELGAFLSPDDRASFARAFGTALRKARR